MEKNVKQTLSLDELLLEDAKKHLKEYAKLCDENECDDYAEINCDLKLLNVGILQEIRNYLLKNGSPSVYTKTAEITCLGRKTVYRHLRS